MLTCYGSRDWEGALETIGLCRSSGNNFGLTDRFGLYRTRIEAFRESALLGLVCRVLINALC